MFRSRPLFSGQSRRLMKKIARKAVSLSAGHKKGSFELAPDDACLCSRTFPAGALITLRKASDLPRLAIGFQRCAVRPWVAAKPPSERQCSSACERVVH